MNKKLPKIIQEVGFDFWWDINKVWQLDIPVQEINIKELIWHFEIPFWATEHGYYNLKPIAVINNPDKYPDHYQRIIKSNLDYPMDIMLNKGRWLFLDGLHRLAKAKILNQDKVKVRKIDRRFKSKIIRYNP